jgi:hypothetical protein
MPDSPAVIVVRNGWLVRFSLGRETAILRYTPNVDDST